MTVETHSMTRITRIKYQRISTKEKENGKKKNKKKKETMKPK